MTKEEKEKLKLDIETRIGKISEQIEELKELTKPIEPDCAIGRVSRMDAINNKSINDAALQKKEIQLSGLYEALKNIDNDDFGRCLICGAEIQIGRILIMPENRKCINCSKRV